ncbi:Bcr/CflA family multidrug efflux MFS transporter [Photobacterium halotolerans]|uniref:Bcr/CflA family efflux transporter n=1 Tax=Photobacterium halotolerans TaxID=265726 RepID=A0A7X4WC88_9GAMM|nr:Bcr/CflA family multidrug efflux MFS transporter [Photobacterium halotolerans]NAW66056.1 Bcr/CflA family multidrug efflux MFS transporter [Photobacterium halotolerans]NAW86500.1 Bcr/CflA family multidrug efflux MFS transporter [Photobacterium halotolerans]
MNKSDSPGLSFSLILILGAIAALTPLAIDMYLPAMPTIAKDLGVSPSLVQVTLTAYTAGFAVGQLIHGPLSDSYGRRPVLIIGVMLFALAAVVSAMSHNINELTWIRAAQGFAGASAAVIIQALVRDMFEREEFARTMSFVTLVMTIAPLAAPMIGGYLSVWFGWRSIFWFLALVSVIVILAVLKMIPETLPAEKRLPFHLGSTLRNYARMLTSGPALGLVVSSGFSFAGMFVFLTVGSFVYIDLYHVSTENFGLLFGLNVICLIVMTTLNGKLVRKMGSHFMLRLGLIIQLIAGAGLIAGQVLELGLWGVVVPVMLFVGAISTVASNSMACLLAKYPHMAGTASSLAGTMRFGTGTVVGGIVAAMPDTTAWPLAGTMAACAVFACLFYWGLAKDA